ncbi:MAG TPA: FtsX-like permease family protein [Acidobacteriota bacterium]|nr:FtsX-like permease family protein [Acidobacteriota bacterium]
MKFVRFLVKNVLRNKRRTLLTMSSIAVSLFLVATLLTLLDQLTNPPETPDSALRLITRHRISLFNVIPMSHGEKIREVEGVEAAYGSMWFGGVYKDPSNFFANFSVEADQFFEVNRDMIVPEDQKEAFINDRTGAVAGDSLAERFGWEIGDIIHLEGALFSFDPELTLRAIYSGGADDGSSLFFHWDYFDEGMNRAGIIGTYTIRTSSPEVLPAVAETIDSMLRSSTAPTKTETEREFILGFVNMLGNVQLFITSIVSVVIFTIVLVAANTMAMSIRERIREVGILKALGFRSSQVMALFLVESVLLALSGAMLGALAAWLVLPALNMAAISGGFVQRLAVTTPTLLLCAGIGLAVGVIAAGYPSWSASRRPTVQCLRMTA